METAVLVDSQILKLFVRQNAHIGNRVEQGARSHSSGKDVLIRAVSCLPLRLNGDDLGAVLYDRQEFGVPQP